MRDGAYWRELFVGVDAHVPLLTGGQRTFVNLDNAATTPAFRTVAEHATENLQWYASVHRGTGYKSLYSTHRFNACRETVMAFTGADPSYHTAIFCANATDAVNRLCIRFPLAPGDVVLTSVLEHHSNLLPWRFHGVVDYVRARYPCGMLDVDHLEDKLREHRGRVKLVAVCGASNITGLIPPMSTIARLAHEHGAMLLVDASQLIAHRPVRLGNANDPERIDFLVFSGHKMYAPFGSGVLIGPRAFFDQGRPGLVGGGTVDLVTLDDIEWAGVPEKEEAGTPNLIGICALAEAARTLQTVGIERIAQHEQELTYALLERLAAIPAIHVFGGCTMVNLTQRLGVVPFQLGGYPHALLAAILGYEWGIGVRSGCFCAHPYVEHLLQIDDASIRGHFARVRAGDHTDLPGFVRISLAPYNTIDELDYLATALWTIAANGPRAAYAVIPETGAYQPANYAYDFGDPKPDVSG